MVCRRSRLVLVKISRENCGFQFSSGFCAIFLVLHRAETGQNPFDSGLFGYRLTSTEILFWNMNDNRSNLYLLTQFESFAMTMQF